MKSVGNYRESPKYLCISLAKPNTPEPNAHISVTIGFLINESLKKKVQFLNDPNIPSKWVNETCERCPIPNCNERAAKPAIIKNEKKIETIETALSELS